MSVSDEELNEATESVIYSQYFPIKGAVWEDRYSRTSIIRTRRDLGK